MPGITYRTDNWAQAAEWGHEYCLALAERVVEVAVEEIQSRCPISDNDAEDHIHMIATVGGEVTEGDGDAVVATWWVGADYASYVNFGTYKQEANPFFTDGTNAVQDRMGEMQEEVAGDLARGGSTGASSGDGGGGPEE